MALRLFNYRKENTILHKIPAIVKILFMTVFCITVFIGSNGQDKYHKVLNFQFLYCICVDILLMILGKGKLSDVLQMRWILWFGLFVTIFRLIPNDISIFKSYELYKPIMVDALKNGLIYTARFFFSTFACQMIFITTSGIEIRESFENVHKVICRFFPFMEKFNLAFIISLAITFIPEIFQFWEEVSKASKNRIGSKKGLVTFFRCLYQKISAVINIILTKAEIIEKAILNRGFEM
ncbi:MAG: energy-coupling factor transporter transmembrane protein EcfT [Treponema sp.]|nr:energy-coupling factor transporter transmembrane protein EcfT [Treponema sp.]